MKKSVFYCLLGVGLWWAGQQPLLAQQKVRVNVSEYSATVSIDGKPTTKKGSFEITVPKGGCVEVMAEATGFESQTVKFCDDKKVKLPANYQMALKKGSGSTTASVGGTGGGAPKQTDAQKKADDTPAVKQEAAPEADKPAKQAETVKPKKEKEKKEAEADTKTAETVKPEKTKEKKEKPKVDLNLGPKSEAFEQGQIDVNAGVGLLPVGYGFGWNATGYSGSFLPLSLSVDYGITDNISVGGYGNFYRVTYSTDFFGAGRSRWSYNFIIVGARGAYHFPLGVDQLDAYGGVMLGYRIVNYTYTGPDADLFAGRNALTGGVAYSLFLGARYRFTDNIGVFGEFGYGVSLIQAGLNLKF
ncbi:MAG: porin family protein [Bernardetiaceae bacterium]|jgi:hypothetical protein|nr:porin family protein [Bernardetiaceae bacterium]